MHSAAAQSRFSTAPVRPTLPARARAGASRVSCSASVTARVGPSPPAVPNTRILRIPTGEPTKPTPTITTTTTASPPDTDSAATACLDYQSLFVSQRRETASPVLLRTVEGAVPADFPAGTYYLAGPGLFADDHGSTVHPLDGHGYLRAFVFQSGERGAVKYSARYVATGPQREERDEETGEWRFTHRGPFSVLKAGRKVGNTKVMKNVANTSVLVWGGRLLCLWEGGDPYELDPATLDTVGLFDVVSRGVVNGEHEAIARGGSPRNGVHRLGELGLDAAAALLKPILHGVFKMPAKRLLSHYRIDARRNRLLMLACNAEDMLLPRSNFTFYEFDSKFRLLQKKDFTIPDHLMIHDWAFTEDHYILVGNRIKLDVPGSLQAVSGHSPMISALSVNPSRQTSPIYLLPRSSDGGCRRDWRVPIEAPDQLWVLHVGNAFERRVGAGEVEFQLLASACSYRWFNFQKMFGYNWQNGKLDPSFMNPRKGQQTLLPHLVKLSIHMDADGNCKQCSVHEASDRWRKPADFPAINPAFSGSRNNYVFAGTTSGSRRFLPHFPFDSVAKLNCSNGSVDIWSAGRRRFVGEPVFVPRRGSAAAEDDGYILVVEYAVWKRRCYLLILDAKHIGRVDAVVARIEVPKHLNFPLGFHGFWAGSSPIQEVATSTVLHTIGFKSPNMASVNRKDLSSSGRYVVTAS